MINLSSHLKLKLPREAFPTYKTSPIVHLSLCYHVCTVHLAGNPQPLPHSVPLLSGKNASLHLCMHTLISDVTQQLLHPSSEQLITCRVLTTPATPPHSPLPFPHLFIKLSFTLPILCNGSHLSSSAH